MHPDSQLTESAKVNFKKKRNKQLFESNCKTTPTVQKLPNAYFKSLTFLTNGECTGTNETGPIQQETIRKNLWDYLFDNTTPKTTPVKAINNATVVADTPIEYYGLSVIERRRRGLNC